MNNKKIVNNKCKVKILGTGEYLPKKLVTAEQLSEKLGVPAEWILKKSGVKKRYFISEGETASKMGALAAKQALENASIELNEIDAVVCASGTYEMMIPCTAALIHYELGCHSSSIPAFDINSTCLSFVTGLDLMSQMIEGGRYKKVLLISTEVASALLDWSHLESATLFGDGAAAVVLGQSDGDSSSMILGAYMATHSECFSYCTIEGGGSKLPASRHHPENSKRYLFQMDGEKVFKKASREIQAFLNALLERSSLSSNEVSLYIPHQASQMAMRILQKKLNIPDEKWMRTVEERGNTVAASIPMALHQAIQHNRLKRGDKVVLFGTSAGLSLGGVALEY